MQGGEQDEVFALSSLVLAYYLGLQLYPDAVLLKIGKLHIPVENS